MSGYRDDDPHYISPEEEKAREEADAEALIEAHERPFDPDVDSVDETPAPTEAGNDQKVAEITDDVVRGAMDWIVANLDGSPGAVLGGAMTALVRFTIQHMFIAPAVPTVRGVFDLLIKPLNRSAEGLLRPPPKGQQN